MVGFLAPLVPLAEAGLAGLGRAGLGRAGLWFAERQAAKKTAEIGLRSMNAARGVEPLTKGGIAMGAAGAASAGLSAADGMNAAANGDVGGMAMGALGMIPGISTMRSVGRAAKGFLDTAVPGGYVAADLLNRAGVIDALTPSGTVPSVPTKQPAAAQQARQEAPVGATPAANPAANPAAEVSRQRAELAAQQDANRTSGIQALGVGAGRNYQEITDDLRNLADRGPQQWDTSLRDMSEWEADTRRREIRMAYRDHPIPGKGEGKVLQFDNDLQKRRESIENSRISGFGQNVSAFDKSLSALSQANGQSVDMADKMFGQTATRRGQDITAQKNLWDADSNNKIATSQLFTALGGLGGGGAKSGSPYKAEKERLDYLKSLAETQYPDNPQGQKKLIDSVLLNSENGKAWDRFMQDGMPNVANELLTTMTDQTTYAPEQLGAATRSRFDFGDQLKGQWADLGNSNKDDTTWFEPRYTIPGRSDSVNERMLASLKGQSVTDLMKQAALNPTQQVSGMPFTYADFGGDEVAFQRAVMSHFQKAHDSSRREQVQ